MFKKISILAAAAATAIAASAMGSASLSFTAYPTSQLPAAYQANYTAYSVVFTPTATDKLTGFVISPLAGGVAGTGITASNMLERQTVNANGDGYDPTPFGSTVPSAGSATSIDSRAVLIVTNPGPINATDNITNVTTPGDLNANTPQVGEGTILQGIFAFPTTLNVGQASQGLYLVLKNGTSATINAQIATAQGVSNISNFVVPGVPEPTSVALAGLAIVGLAKRRRA